MHLKWDFCNFRTYNFTRLSRAWLFFFFVQKAYTVIIYAMLRVISHLFDLNVSLWKMLINDHGYNLFGGFDKSKVVRTNTTVINIKNTDDLYLPLTMSNHIMTTTPTSCSKLSWRVECLTVIDKTLMLSTRFINQRSTPFSFWPMRSTNAVMVKVVLQLTVSAAFTVVFNLLCVSSLLLFQSSVGSYPYGYGVCLKLWPEFFR